MLRIGLMGCGTVADYGHLPAIKAVPALDLVAIFDPHPERLAAAREKFGVKNAFTDVDAFLASGLDAVTITSPAPFHRDNVMDAAGHKLHVLCEKPLAMNEAEARAMVEAMRKADRSLYVGFTYRFSPAAQEIRRLIDEGAVGDVRSLRLVYIWDCHGKYASRDIGETRLNERRVGRMLEGGPLVDCGVHQIDLARWWTGSEVVRYTGFGAWVDEGNYEAPDHVWLQMDHANGTHSMVELSFSYGHTTDKCRPHYVSEIIGSKGLIRYCLEEESFELRTAEGVTKLPWHGAKQFEAMYTAFARAIETGDPGSLASAEDGIIATKIADQATKQAIADRVHSEVVGV